MTAAACAAGPFAYVALISCGRTTLLAVWTEYLHSWQLFVLLPIILLWLIGGGLAIGYGIRRATGSKRARPEKGILATLLASLAAGFAVGVVLYLSLQIASAIKDTSVGGAGPYIVVGGLIGLIVGLAAAFSVYFAMFAATARQTFKAVALPMLALLIVCGASALIAYKPTVEATNDKRNSLICQNNLKVICNSLGKVNGDVSVERLFAQFPPKAGTTPPTKLDQLSDEFRKIFNCPSHADQEIGYVFYFDNDSTAVTDMLAVADRPGNHRDTVNVITMTRTVDAANGRVTRNFQNASVPMEGFQQMLKEPVNAAFAKAYNASK